jgi:hypothetical protein
MKYRLQLYIDEGVVPLGSLAQRLWAVIDSWRATDPRADGWRYEIDSGTARVASVEDCAGALEANAYAWRLGDQTRVSYEPILFVGEPDAPPVRVTYACGIGEIGLEGIFVPSRFEAIVDSRWTADNGAALLQTWMLKAVEVLRPRFGHAGSLEIPRPVMPLTPGQLPPVGWLTYLSDALGQIPARLPHPAVAYPAPGGMLVVAHPELFLEYKSAHREAVAVLRVALEAAGVVAPLSAR